MLADAAINRRASARGCPTGGCQSRTGGYNRLRQRAPARVQLRKEGRMPRARFLSPTGVLVLVLLLAVAGCARGPISSTPNDPFEATNRAWFDRNLALTSAFSGGAEPEAEPRDRPGLRLVRNFGSNLGTPSHVINDLLQVRPDRAMQNTLRFAVNSTIGLAGLFDPASHIGLTGRSTDFGETLHRWGAPEGAYVVLPVLGPSTERDTIGMIVDSLINPWDFVVTPQQARAITVARWAGRFASAREYADLIDANVIRTEDPYAQARLLFLQARRHHLGIQTEDDSFDPYDFLD
jgi:phospholipid-binding lipoprotein MlaA